jgi:hypothetical protein
MLLIGLELLWILFPPDVDETELKSATNFNSESKEDALDFCAQRVGWWFILYTLSNLSDDVLISANRHQPFMVPRGLFVRVPPRKEAVNEGIENRGPGHCGIRMNISHDFLFNLGKQLGRVTHESTM